MTTQKNKDTLSLSKEENKNEILISVLSSFALKEEIVGPQQRPPRNLFLKK